MKGNIQSPIETSIDVSTEVEQTGRLLPQNGEPTDTPVKVRARDQFGNPCGCNVLRSEGFSTSDKRCYPRASTSPFALAVLFGTTCRALKDGTTLLFGKRWKPPPRIPTSLLNLR